MESGVRKRATTFLLQKSIWTNYQLLLAKNRDREGVVVYTNGGEFADCFGDMSVNDALTVVGGEHSMALSPPLEIGQRELATWNATQQDYPRNLCVPQLVARQTGATPGAVALVAGAQTHNYQELNRRANQLAHYLQALGVQPNVLVGLCVERSLGMVVRLLDILRAGGAYMPLDPTHPSEWLTFMMVDAQAPVLVTQQHLMPRLAIQGTHVVCLDADAGLLAHQCATDPTSVVTTDDLAYVIYTSGSTGCPKGVQITHDSLLNLVFWHQRAFAVTLSDRATQLTSPAFDATGWELWPYLTAGASVYLPVDGIRVAPTLPFTAINNYGPTETTLGQVPPTTQAPMPPPIGRPIANTQIYILDEQLRQVPSGLPGEIYIGGAGLSRGYLNRPELTAEKFIPHPFSNKPGARLYKTGELARFLPDGQIAFLGRTDQQIKIRGYLVEPDGIVSMLELVINKQPSMSLRMADSSARPSIGAAP